MVDWILRQAHITDDGPLVDIAIQAGRITVVGPTLPLTATETWDLQGRVVLPGLVDAHTHLDKTYAPTHNQSGTLREAIDVWRQIKRQRSNALIQASVRRALETAIVNGVTAMRSHVDVEEMGDLVAVAALLAIREEFRNWIDLQFVALGDPAGPQESREAMRCALEMGIDIVGGAPSLTENPRASIDAAFALAEQYGKALDLHIDETEDPQMLCLEYLAEQALAHSMTGQVTAGHCCSLAFVDEPTAARVIDKVAQAQIQMITLPSCNLVLMGRGMQPVPRGITRVKELLAGGVNVCAASDNVQDPFNPFGAYDLLQIANLNAHVAHLSGTTEIYTSLAMVTTRAAQVMGLPAAGIVVGAPADLLVVDAQRVLEAVTAPPLRLATFKAGKLLVQTKVERAWRKDDKMTG